MIVAKLHRCAVVELLGPDARRFANGMFTNNVRDLPVGAGNRHAACDPKGKLHGMHDLYAASDARLVLVVEGAGPPEAIAEDFERRFGKFVVLDDVELVDRSGTAQVVTVQGDGAEAFLRARGWPVPGPIFVAKGPEGQDVPGYSWVEADGVAVMRRDRGGAGFDVILPIAVAVGDPDDRAIDPLRVARGEVRWPDDMPARFLLHELGLRDVACSFEKGCYVGQEIVHRVDVMGQVKRRLVVVRAERGPWVPGDVELRLGERTVGRLTSPVWSEAGALGLAVVRAPEDAVGTSLDVVAADGVCGGVVVR